MFNTLYLAAYSAGQLEPAKYGSTPERCDSMPALRAQHRKKQDKIRADHYRCQRIA